MLLFLAALARQKRSTTPVSLCAGTLSSKTDPLKMHKGMLTLPHPCVIRKKTNSWEKVCERHYQTSQRIPGGHLSLSLALCW